MVKIFRPNGQFYHYYYNSTMNLFDSLVKAKGAGFKKEWIIEGYVLGG